MIANLSFVIPGRRAAANPESIINDRDYGFRAQPFGLSRNDGATLHHDSGKD